MSTGSVLGLEQHGTYSRKPCLPPPLTTPPLQTVTPQSHGSLPKLLQQQLESRFARHRPSPCSDCRGGETWANLPALLIMEKSIFMWKQVQRKRFSMLWEKNPKAYPVSDGFGAGWKFWPTTRNKDIWTMTRFDLVHFVYINNGKGEIHKK